MSRWVIEGVSYQNTIYTSYIWPLVMSCILIWTYTLVLYPIFINAYFYRMKTEARPSKATTAKKRPQRQNASAKDCTINIAYWNLNGFDFQSAWVIEKLLQEKVLLRPTKHHSSSICYFRTSRFLRYLKHIIAKTSPEKDLVLMVTKSGTLTVEGRTK